MKKIIALALSLAMVLSMGVVALADHTDCDAIEGTCEVGGNHLLPGEKYAIDSANATLLGITETFDLGEVEPTGDELDISKWKVSTDWDMGSALVSGIAYDKDDECWYLTLKENYTITTAKTLKGEITFEGKGVNKDADDVVITIDTTVSNHLVEIVGYEDLEDAEDDPYEAEDNVVYKCEEDEGGYVVFNDGRLLGVTLKMESEEKVYAANNETMIDALAEKYPDADIECYSFGSIRTLKNKATLTLQADYSSQYYVYTYENGKLVAQDYDWDSIEGVYTWETKELGSYVISDVELVAAAEADGEEADAKNPDTGANDVVGVAAALAVVSLVAAGAVSLKK